MQATADNNADIYIYEEIGYWGVTAKRFVSDLVGLGDDIEHINLHINSPGGDVFDGIAIYNALKNHGAAITVYVDGLAASMASVIAMVGDPVVMPENAMMMIHKPWGFAGGDAEDMRDYADLLDKVENSLIPAYVAKTGKSAEEIAAMLEDETWMDGNECMALGFSDQVMPAVKAMASIQSKRLEEFEKMPQSIRNMLTAPRGSAARAPAKTTTTTTVPEDASAEDIRAQVVAEQKERVKGIQNVFAMFGGKYPEIEAECIADVDCSVADAKDKILAHLGKDATPSNGASGKLHIYAGNGNIVGDSIRQAIMVRAGYEKTDKENVYNGMTLREHARMSLTERGVGVASLNPMQMIATAFTHSSSDFGNILLDIAHKSLLNGWEEAKESFEIWTNKGELSDFKTTKVVGLNDFPALLEVKEGAEFKYGTTSDRGEPIALATYGRLFSITRQAIINDDMRQLTKIPQKMGRAAKATIGDLVYAVLTQNATMSDNTPIFHADHNNITTGAISIASMDGARQLMMKQEDASSKRPLNIRPAYMLVPVALEATANQTIRSASVKGADINSGVDNPLRNFAEPVSEARLDKHDAAAWYLTSAQGTDTIEVAYLNGVDTPYLDQQEGFTSDGIINKIRVDAGVAALDHRGMVKSSGK